MRNTEINSANGKVFTAKKKSAKEVWKDNWEYLLMCLPMVLKILVFSVLPMLWLLMAFQDYKGFQGLFGSAWVGFDNFEYFFKSGRIWRSIRNTLGLNLMFIAVGTPITIAMALFMFEMKSRFTTKLFQTIYFFPYLISWVIVQYCTDAILANNGIVNGIVQAFGGARVDFFATKSAGLWPLILLFCNIWKNTGYSLIMYYSALQSLDTSLIEAAELDGAGKLRVMWHVSLPHLRRIVAILLIMSMGGVFRSDFGLFWFIPQNDISGALLSTTETLDTYVYQMSILNFNYSTGTAISLVQSLVGMGTLLLTNYIVKLIDRESAYI
ncbi:MAG: sugar ABC transporter permease [Clostridia bacterium]|nr:sugar ABC transporter permease [Clostridia bacterium]